MDDFLDVFHEKTIKILVTKYFACLQSCSPGCSAYKGFFILYFYQRKSLLKNKPIYDSTALPIREILRFSDPAIPNLFYTCMSSGERNSFFEGQQNLKRKIKKSFIVIQQLCFVM